MIPGDTRDAAELRHLRRRISPSLYVIALGALVLIVAIWIAALYAIRHERTTALDSARNETVNLATAFEEHTIRTIRAIENMIARVTEVMERRGPVVAEREMKALHASNEELLTVISIADRHGDITVSSLPAGTMNIAHNEHFRIHAERADAGLVFGIPMQGQRTKQWTMYVTRRINAPDGSFNGIVAIGIELDYLNAFYRGIDVGEHGLITLLGSDGYLRAQGGSRGVAGPQNLRGTSQVIERVESGETRGSITTVSAIDGVRRIVSFRALAAYPLIVTVGKSEAEALQHFATIQRNYVTGAAVLTALVALLAAALATLFRQQLQATERLRMSEARFRVFTDLGADWYWESDALDRLTFTSASVSRWTGSDGSAHIGKTLNELGFLSIAELPGKPQAPLDTRQPFRDSRIRYISPRGQVHYLSTSGAPMFNADGRFAGHRGICRDITTEVRLRHHLSLKNEAVRLFTGNGPTEEVITELLREVCITFDWAWGIRRVVDIQAGTITCAESWCVPALECTEVVRVTRTTAYSLRPDGIVAAALESGEPLWRTDVSRFPEWRRADLARKAGVRDVVVLPVPYGVGTRYVLQFCSQYAEYPDPMTLETLRAVVAELAQFLAGRAAQVERERLQQRHALVESLARAASEAATPDEAMHACLARLCTAGDWVLGRAATYEPGSDLRFPGHSFWHREKPGLYEEFIRISENIDYLTRTGPFINCVLRERKAIWLEDTQKVPGFNRGPAALRAGLHAAFAFPILVQGEVAGFLELYATAPRPVDPDLTAAAETIAAQVARLIERGRAQAATAHLAAIVENSNDAIVSRSLDRRILTWNAAAARLFGYSAGEIVGRVAGFLIPPDEQPVAEHARKALNRGEAIRPSDVVRIAKDGRRLDLSLTPSPIKDAAGRTVAVSLVFRDISERKRAQQELERKTALAQLLESLARSANEARTPEEAMRFCLARVCEDGAWALGRLGMYGRGEGGFVPGHSVWHERVPGNYHAFKEASADSRQFSHLGRFITAVVREKRPVWIEDITAPPGRGRLATAAACGLRAAFAFPVSVHGEVVAFLEFYAYERRVADRMLLDASTSVGAMLARLIERSRAAEEQERLAAIVETSGDAIWSRAVDDTLVSWNASAERLFGWKREEVLGRRENFLVPPERLHERSMIPERLARGEDSVTFETVRLRRDGSPIDVRMTASVVRDDAGHVRWTAFIVHDISERKAAETAQREYSQRLQVLSRMVLEAQETERASLARELHDQLGPMLGAAKLGLQVFQRHHKDGAASLNDIIATVDQAMQQTRTLALDLRPPQLDELGLATTVRSYAERLAKSSRLRLHFEAGELPELASQIDIACFRVAQVALTNVVQHAGAANVWVSLSVENDMLCLRVRDDGSGFHLQQAQRQALRGNSMGLLSMEERTALAGGRFAIQSEPDAGTRIEARFPLSTVALALGQEA